MWCIRAMEYYKAVKTKELCTKPEINLNNTVFIKKQDLEYLPVV